MHTDTSATTFATTQGTDMQVLLTDSAAMRIKQLREQEKNQNLKLRIRVLGGGCSGFQYGIALSDATEPDDVVFEHNGAHLVTDATSLPFLNGSKVDFEKTMIKSAFKIHNPNAASGCGCGKSFSV